MTTIGKPAPLAGAGVNPDAIEVPDLPPELLAAQQQASEQRTSQTSKQASLQVSNKASKGKPNQAAPIGPDLSMFMGAPVDPNKDQINPSYQFPRYWIEAVRLIAFYLKAKQKEVAQSLFYAGAMGTPYDGPLANVDPKWVASVFRQCYQTALTQPSNNGE